MDPDTFERLLSEDWPTIYPRLGLFAEQRARMYSWRTGGHWDLVQGWTPEDVVHHVIEKTFRGDRQWDPSKGPLEPWLKDQIKSVVDALYHSSARRREAWSLQEEGAPELIDRVLAQQDDVGGLPGSQVQNPEDMLLEEEKRAAVQIAVRKLFDAVDGRPELEEIMDAILGGCEPKPRFLAAAIGVTVREIENRIRRLKRLVLKGGNQ